MEIRLATGAVNEQDFALDPRESLNVSEQTRLPADFSSARSPVVEPRGEL